MKTTVLSSVVIASAMAAGAAQAEPLTMTAAQMDEVTAAGVVDVGFTLTSTVHKDVRVDIAKTYPPDDDTNIFSKQVNLTYGPLNLGLTIDDRGHGDLPDWWPMDLPHHGFGGG
jgi:hypothetical protein